MEKACIAVTLWCLLASVACSQSCVQYSKESSNGVRVALNCSAEAISVEITADEYIDILFGLNMTCTTGKTVSANQMYYRDGGPGLDRLLVGHGRDAKVTFSVTDRRIIPGSTCILANGKYRKREESRHILKLPTASCCIPALPPQVTDLVVKEGEDVNLLCINNNQQGVTQQWLDSDSNMMSTNTSLRLKSVTRHYTGTYTCVLSGVDNYTVEKNATIVVQYAPKVNNLNGIIHERATVGDNVSLSCVYDGVPTPTVRWLYNNVELMNDTDQIVNEENQSILFLSNVELEDAGSYSCEASNSVGADAAHVTLTVTSPEEPSTLSAQDSSEPESPIFFTSKLYLLVLAGIFIALVFALATIMTIFIFCLRKRKKRNYSNYHIHFYLHSEFDRNYEPVKLDFRPWLSKSLETVLHSPNVTNDPIKVTTKYTCKRCNDDTCSEHSQNSDNESDSETVEKENSTGTCSLDLQQKSNEKHFYQPKKKNSQELLELTKNDSENVHPAPSDDNHPVESTVIPIDSYDLGDSSLHHTVLPDVNQLTSFTSCEHELISEAGYIVRDSEYIDYTERFTNNNTTKDNTSHFPDSEHRTRPTHINLREESIPLQTNLKYSDINAFLLNNSSKVNNQTQSNHSQHSDDDITPTTASTVLSSSSGIRFLLGNYRGDYIPSDESGYNSSQIPSECDSSYKLRELDNEDFFIEVADD